MIDLLGLVLYGLDKLNPILEVTHPTTRGAMGKLLLATRVASAIRLARRPGRLAKRVALQTGMNLLQRAAARR